jgi:protein TonB
MPQLRTVDLPHTSPSPARVGKSTGAGFFAALVFHIALIAIFSGIVLHHKVSEPPAVTISAVEEPPVHREPIPQPKPIQPLIAAKQSTPTFDLPKIQTEIATLQDLPLKPDDFGQPWPQPKPKAAKPKPKPASAPVVAKKPIIKTIPARVQRSVPPLYPTSARRAGIEGTAKIRLQIGSDGKVQSSSIAVSSGHKTLDTAALTAAQKWRFIPAKQGSNTIPSTVVVPIRFTLR